MVAVPVASLVAGMKVPVDVYLSLNDERFVLIFKNGSALDATRMQEFVQRGLRELYVRKEDYPGFFNRQVAIAGILIQHPKVPSAQKIEFLHVSGELILKKFELMGFAGESFEVARATAKSVITLVSSEPGLLDVLARFNEISNTLFNHSMAVGIASVIIGRSMDWTRQETLEKLALGGLLHDIGLQEISPTLLGKKRSEMSYEEVKEYESHAFRGMQILQGLDFIPQDLVAIAYEHHENSIGQGYPRRLWDMKINPLARVISLADTFCDLTMMSDTNTKPKKPSEALWHIEAMMGQPFNKDAFRSFKALVKTTKAA